MLNIMTGKKIENIVEKLVIIFQVPIQRGALK